MAGLDAGERVALPAGQGGEEPRERGQRDGEDHVRGLEVAGVRPHDAVLDRADGRAEPDAVAEPRGERQRQTLVPARDAVAGKRGEGRDVLEHARGEPLRALGRGDLDAREHRLGDGRGQPEPADQLGDRAVALHRPGERGARRLEVGRRRRDPARLALVVAHARVREREALARREAAQLVVAVEHELRAALDHRAREPRGPDAPADAVARLQHEHVRAALREPVGGGEAREARADDDRAAAHARWTIRPAIIVRSTPVRAISPTGISRRSRSSTMRSASSPASSRPGHLLLVELERARARCACPAPRAA